MDRYDPLKIEKKWRDIYLDTEAYKAILTNKGSHNDPYEVINSGYGIDTLHAYILFTEHFDMDKPWDYHTIGAIYRFLNRCWKLCFASEPPESQDSLIARHNAIKKITVDIEKQKYHTAIAALMKYVNTLYKHGASHADLAILAKLLKPFAPHLAYEMLEFLDENDEWPDWNDKYIIPNYYKKR